MSLITKYAVYFDLFRPQISYAGQAKSSPEISGSYSQVGYC